MSSSDDAKFLHYLVSISGVVRTDRVLDVACGPGACTLAFAGRCRHAVGLDPSPDLIAEARTEAARAGARNAEFMAGEVERMGFRDCAFDAAVCRFAFHHFTNPARVFAEMARVVAPRGWMVVVDVTASEDPARAAAHNELERLCDPTHVRMLAASEFEPIFAAAGFTVAMKIARQSTSTVEEWTRFGDPPPENLPLIRAMLEDAVDDDRPGLALQRDAGTIRLMHTSVSFVLERSARSPPDRGSEPMKDQDDNLTSVQRQFRRQAEAYSTMKVVTDPRILEQMVEISEVRPDSRVLDVACGPGFVAMAFAPRCQDVLGIDATDTLVARARAEAGRRGISNLRFALANVERMPLASARFDLATCRFAFHHFAHPRAVLAEMTRVLKPGGRMVIVDMTTCEDQAKSDYHNRLERLCDPSHARAIPVSEWERMIAETGLEAVYRGGRETSYDLESWMAHGGPPPDRRAQIVEMMEASLAADRSGLKVRRENGQIWFSHTGVTYALEKPMR